MRTQSFDEELSRLRTIARGTISGEAVDILRHALNGSQGVLAALAADTAGHRGIHDLEPDLVRAFDRFMSSTDKGCQAKTAIVESLERLGHRDDDVYLRGIKHVQMEPAFGEFVDTAADLRAACAVALANTQHREAVVELTNLLLDPEVKPRRAAVKALAHLGTEAAEVAIRLKAQAGDGDLDVLAECFSALLAIAPGRSLSFLQRFLEEPDERLMEQAQLALRQSHAGVAEQAALALGQSREAEAFEILREAWESNPSPEFHLTLLLPISLLRRDEAFAFLIEVIQKGGGKLATAAVTALGIHADDKIRSMVHDAVTHKQNALVSEAFAREFGRID